MARISKEHLLKLQKKYKSDAAIGALFNISRQAVFNLRKKYGIEPVQNKYDDRNKEIHRLYANGLPLKTLVRKYRLSLPQIARIVRDASPAQKIQRRKNKANRPRKPVRK